MVLSSEMKAKQLGAWSRKGGYATLWTYSKRELIEVAIHLAARLDPESYEESLESQRALGVVLDEVRNLKRQRLI